MKIINNDNFVILEDEQNNLKNFATFLEFQVNKKFKAQNVVLDLSQNSDLQLDELLYFLNISNSHRSTRHSLVIINNAINPDNIPAEMTVVPTLQEAEDIIEMEEIERELGF